MKKFWMITFLLIGAGLIGIPLLIQADYAAFAQDPPTPTPPPDFEGLPLPADRGTLFTGAGACTNCHTNMVDESGADVSIDAFWRSTMMANASRDPYWQASVQVEVAKVPDLQPVIEDKCAQCHMPMAQYDITTAGRAALMFDADGLLNPAQELHALAMDGVSCTLCHQIEPTGLGQPESFSGGFVIDTSLPMGERLVYSRFKVEDNPANMMAGASGFLPVQGMHTTEAKLCASCHTLYTPYLDASGQIAGEFPEQTPYLEWLHGDFAQAISCQGCHMPPAANGVVTSITGGAPRSPFAQHMFVGGNAYLQNIFRAFGEDMNVTASSAHFDATHGRALDQLSRAATVGLENVSLTGADLTTDVVIKTLTGHKFPTGFPSRRAWLHVTVSAADGQIVFESGAYGSNGQIDGSQHDADPAQYDPHYTTINSPEQVQIYESVMQDTDGNITNTLLRGSSYVKDNRLLPAGFDKSTAEPDFAVYGGAVDDVDFAGGGDRVTYAVHVGEAQGPFTITVDLLYQSIAYHWIEKLRPYDTAESARFLAYVDAVPNLPVMVASATITTGD